MSDARVHPSDSDAYAASLAERMRLEAAAGLPPTTPISVPRCWFVPLAALPSIIEILKGARP